MRGLAHATPGDIEKAGLTRKTKEMFIMEELANATIASHFGFVFEENTLSGRLSRHHLLRKVLFSIKMFSIHTRTKSQLFQIPRVFVTD